MNALKPEPVRAVLRASREDEMLAMLKSIAAKAGPVGDDTEGAWLNHGDLHEIRRLIARAS